MGQWWICPWDNQVVVDEASFRGIDCSCIPDNVYLIWWHGDYGEILYKHKDRLPIRERFDDLSPYIHLFDKWMLRAMSHNPPINLPQARMVKSRMVDALQVRRQQRERAVDHKGRIEQLATVREIVDYDITRDW